MDGLLDIPEHLTIYASETDQALGLSQWLFGRNRLGQMWKERPLKPHIQAYLGNNASLRIVDVSNAESADAGNGHAYFRRSPWVSSDILVSFVLRFAAGATRPGKISGYAGMALSRRLPSSPAVPCYRSIIHQTDSRERIFRKKMHATPKDYNFNSSLQLHHYSRLCQYPWRYSR